ncbi:hypothetical protein RO3G_00144 [Rhizopus delemar RA 99-880]|uniref:Uncharacterized protein n=1 Tax=Rhizopus delemar (strain RA 99-880 / ATCC MYA-4621 / FGSC 9543 / NRRL 43880) TaxID=246409 RepID=I1BGW0_RHIO9|nr:hypothetical protein RO3G_00138 [Rhizopus delemar RA 99-880]EIE75440.1 hypothetical protein RO3G_00144 [Rhizopus delemar RA 99-880]|eukprot:EIE75434.1 hypothetical protein RO3G_00138 [Rhizopus delemar RA 99-880]
MCKYHSSWTGLVSKTTKLRRTVCDHLTEKQVVYLEYTTILQLVAEQSSHTGMAGNPCDKEKKAV